MPEPRIFTSDTLKFLRDLKANNSRDWFNDNKAWYGAAWKAPAEAFIKSMCFRLQIETDAPHDAKLFRIHRDVRFSKDKTPYNSHLHILFRREGSQAGLFFGLQTDRLVLGAGMMGFDKGQLAAYREAVGGAAGDTLKRDLDQLLDDGGRMNDPELARIPKPYDKAHPRGDLLRRKSLTIWYDHDDPSRVENPDLIDLCATRYATYQPLSEWLNAHIPGAADRR